VIFVSLILVIVAAVTLVLGIFADGLGLVYVSIGTCLGAMAVLGVGGLLHRRASAAAQPAGYADDRTAGSTAARPVAASSETVAAASPAETVAVDPVPAGTDAHGTEDEPAMVDPADPADPAELADPADPAGPAARPPVERPAARKTAVRKVVAAEEAPAERSVAKKAAVARVPVEQATTTAATPTPTGSLTDVKGLGPAKRNALLSRFGDEAAVATASLDELTSVPGIGPGLARSIRATLS
jgi:hypothetical protein